MNKITKVKNCSNCPFYDDIDFKTPSCHHPDNIGYKSPVSSKIVPDWCPLKQGDYRRTITTHIKLDI